MYSIQVLGFLFALYAKGALCMARVINTRVKRAEKAYLHMNINTVVYTEFRDCLARYGHPMNMILEIFMWQYVQGRIHLDRDNMMELKYDMGETSLMRTPVNGEVRERYFACCKAEDLPTKVPITAFMKEYAEGKFMPEFRTVEKDSESQK